jgi:hypothetical protein
VRDLFLLFVPSISFCSKFVSIRVHSWLLFYPSRALSTFPSTPSW